MSALTIHGGRIDAAAARYPAAPVPWLDLSTGINPNGYNPAALAEGDPYALPSPSRLAALEDAAAAAFGMTCGAIAAVPGSEIGLRLLATMGLPGPACVVAPSYGSHAAAFPNATPVAGDALAGAEWRSALLANPNNPDGRLLAPETLLALTRSRAADGGWLVIDEAFADCVAGASVLPLLDADDRVLVFRSFGKFYGLAGVRLGFVCGPEAIVARYRERLGSWPVSSAAIEIGIAAYRDVAWQGATRIRVAAQAAALDEVLRRHGLAPRGDCPLFRLVEMPDAGLLFERLAAAGILTRPFDYAPDWLRIGLPGSADALARLDRSLGGG
ncbi:aminotransferase class I/II-fold pyridoxal phosphate-dependent enzyme [Sphingomonas glacialis]|uniref:Pyridoxal phosphate-dependent class II aminotransferase n=1 Tax=Sphingomonas glacialis TaxID=658225 RepID=A0A502FUM0_9SPHN|nr:aminotransferase class I/II-fold pyridoxal phosphate-dependent enzyme [Sphingomonas glacialis]TPG52952.1 pyridoxal phosphate-dependent class II aminotransferase [Sphingomonas glacialis]